MRRAAPSDAQAVIQFTNAIRVKKSDAEAR
jgi:hypothetical protein